MALSYLLCGSALLASSIADISVRETLFGSDWRSKYNIEANSTVLDVSFTNNTYSAYSISVNGEKWLDSGMTGFRNNGDWASLNMTGTETTVGEDAFGAFSDLSIQWIDTKSKTPVSFSTIIRQYPSSPEIVLFMSAFPDGATNASTGSADKVISSFPSFQLNNAKLGYNQWSGSMAGDSERVGKLDGSSEPAGGLNNGAGPFCIFDAAMTNAVVFSPLTDHFASSNYVVQGTDKDKTWQVQWGLLGSIVNVEEDFTATFILSAPRNGGGVNAAMRAWGDRQLTYNGRKQRDSAYDRDFTLNYLGYSTDNGAYYYYHTEDNKNYQETMADVKAYHDKVGLPTKWVLLDSWWYYQGENGGVKNWTARPDIFPGGMQAVYEETKWKIQAHNRYYSLDNVYADNIPDQTEVGNFPFTYGEKSALPTTGEFWDYLFDINMDWGLIVYEQDWESTSADEVPLLSNTTYFGKEWLTQMGYAADKHDLSIQYCMDFTRHLMTSVALPAVTQARASGDYHPGNDQWKTGVTAIFTSAIGIVPSKDSYWSQPDPQSGHYAPGTSEPYNRLQAAVQSLSAGPYTFADRIGYSDADLIMRCCSTSGLVLRPDTSATMIDSYFRYRAGFGNATQMASGEIWSTTTKIGENEAFRWLYVFGVLLDDGLKVFPADISHHLEDDSTIEEWIAFETNSTATFKTFSASSPLQLSASKSKYDFELFTLVPVVPGASDDAWLLQGEVDKWISVSGQRFTDVSSNSNGDLVVTLQGEVGEKVNVGFVNKGSMKQVVVKCTVGETQVMRIRMPAATCEAH